MYGEGASTESRKSANHRHEGSSSELARRNGYGEKQGAAVVARHHHLGRRVVPSLLEGSDRHLHRLRRRPVRGLEDENASFVVDRDEREWDAATARRRTAQEDGPAGVDTLAKVGKVAVLQTRRRSRPFERTHGARPVQRMRQAAPPVRSKVAAHGAG